MDDQAIQSALNQLFVNAPTSLPLPPHATALVPHDPKDDAIVLTAIAGQADVICTRDKHLQHSDVISYCSKYGIRIMTDIELLAHLRQP